MELNRTASRRPPLPGPAISATASTAANTATQRRYAQVLLWGTRFGFVLLVLGFALYALGVIQPHVPLQQLPTLWNQPVAAYLQATGLHTGWGWTALVHRADIFNLVGIALLAGWSAVCLLMVVPLYARAGQRLYVLLCLTQVAVLLLAASNILSVGH